MASRHLREKRSAGWNMRPNRGVCISNTICVAMVGKGWLQNIQWMVFAWKQTQSSSSMAVIGMVVQSVIQNSEWQ